MTEDKIQEAAIAHGNSNDDIYGTGGVAIDSFEAGALSPEAKEYWQQGLYTEEEVLNLLIKMEDSGEISCQHNLQTQIEEWFNQNKRNEK